MLNVKLAPDSFGFDIAFRDHLPSALDMHTHDFCEMVYVFSGTGKHVTEQGVYDMGPGDLFVIPPHRGHSYENRKHMALVNIMFDLNRLPYPADHLISDLHFRAFFMTDESISDDFRIRNKLELSGNDRVQVESLIRKMLGEYNQNKKARSVLLIALLTELFVDIIRFYSAERYAYSKDLILLQNILQYMKDHCSNQITIPELAKKFGLSQKNLERLFLQSIKMPPVTYLIDLRLQTAAEKIRFTKSTISEIAFQCGFSDSNYFTKLFRKKYGMSPRTFRRDMQKFGTSTVCAGTMQK